MKPKKPKKPKKQAGITININLDGGMPQQANKTFYHFQDRFSKIPPDHWLPAKANKNTKAEPIKISDMHTMQLVNAIKWCVKLAAQTIYQNPYYQNNVTIVGLLSKVPQWGHLLLEGKKRRLRMMGHEYEVYPITAPPTIDYELEPWVKEALATITFNELEK